MFRLLQLCCACIVVFLTGSALRGDDTKSPTALEVFEQRIMPIFKSPQPASCVQCHLAGVDLKNYIRPSHEQTFASLRDLGMIDLNEPKKSKILGLIAMGEKDADKGARLIHEKTRQAEYGAFEAWITACCNDPKLRELPRLEETERAQPARPDEVIRHARKSRVVDSFARNIWSQRMRCFPCHTPYEIDPKNPQHKLALEKHESFLKQDDGAFADRMVLFRETPEATVQYLIEKSRLAAKSKELPLINLEDPAKSLLLLKPTSKLPTKTADGKFESPSYNLPVSHMGGLKMHVDDQSYKAFIGWIQDYANVVGDKYTSVADLPADNWLPTKHMVVLREAPEKWPVESRVQLFVHAWNPQTMSWEAAPVAFTQALVGPRRNVVGPLFLFRDANAQESAQKLNPGKHLVKVYYDGSGKLKSDPLLFLGAEEFVGQVEIDAKWGEGLPQAEAITGPQLNQARAERQRD